MSAQGTEARGAARVWVVAPVVVALTSSLTGCADRAATQVVLRIDSDMAEGVELRRVSVAAHYEGAPGQLIIPDASYDLEDGGYGLPGELSIVPRDRGESRRLFINVTGHTREGPVVQRARVRFEEGRTVVVFTYLTRACRATRCGEGETCGNDGRCRPEDQPEVTRDYRPYDGSTDRPVVDAVTDRPAADLAVDLPTVDVVDAGDGGARDGGVIDPFPSTGEEGAFPPEDAATDGGVIHLAPGIHNFTTVHVPLNVRVVTSGEGMLDLRATGAVVVEGTIDLSGGAAAFNNVAGCAGCGSSPTPRAQSGAGGTGTPGHPSSNGTAGGRFGGGTAGFHHTAGGGGGGYCGGGGGATSLYTGGNGASFLEMGEFEEGGVGGTPARPQGGGGCASVNALPMIYRGRDGLVSPPDCLPALAGGGGGGSIGLAAARDLAVRVYFRGGSGGGAGASDTTLRTFTYSGSGGGGGGALRIASPVSILLGQDGTLLANGGDGYRGINTLNVAMGGGGGGSGGVIHLASPSIRLRGRVSVAGGAGGPGERGDTRIPACAVAGGAGGLGRIRLSVDPAQCQVTGPTTPPMPDAGCALSPEGGVPGEVFVGRWPD